MKRNHEAARSTSALPTAVFPAGTPLQTTLAKLEQPARSRAFLPEHPPSPTPESTELFHYTNTLLHRVTGRYLPAAVLGGGPTAHADEVKHLASDPDLMLVMQSVQDLTHQFHEVATSVLSHRRELGKILLKLKGSYVGLFERVLEAAMRFYYTYRSEHAKERHDQKQELLNQSRVIQEHEESIRVLTHHLEAKEVLVQSQRVTIQDLEFHNHALHALEATWLELQDEYRELKRFKLSCDKREELLQQREETLQTKEETLTRHAHFLEVQAKTEHGRIIEEARKYKEAYTKAVEEIHDAHEPSPDSPYDHRFGPRADASTQTTADDDGLWDVQDGVPKAVSTSVQARTMWRRFHAFVRCKNCHGRPLVTRAPTEVDEARYSLQELLQHIEMLYDAKYEADRLDAADGVAYQPLDQFVAEYYLKSCNGRQDAEVQFYKLLISIKALYLTSPALHLFARFLQLLDRENAEQRRYRFDPDIDEKAQASKMELNALGVPPQQCLNQSYLRVFLDARHNALHHPELGTDHLVSVNGVATKWIALEYGIRLLKWYLSYLPAERRQVYYRQLEHCTGILLHGTITDTRGNQLAVRAQMRLVMLGTDTSRTDGDAPPRRRDVVVVSVHVVLELIVDVLLMRTKGIEIELTELFESGDVNHDHVLSFPEFCAILKPRAPEFNERRLLRMFREALLLGQDPSYAITVDAFIQVCTDHGLVALVSNATFEFSKRSLRHSPPKRQSRSFNATTSPLRRGTVGAPPPRYPPKPTLLSASATSTNGNEAVSTSGDDEIVEDLPPHDDGDDDDDDGDATTPHLELSHATDAPIAEEIESAA
ncbi:hypothetical protein SPRG_01685 [Saprolegnia parasitica CBS 223.65]|uniref:EF-hand domain-containing protein n=1 Tax=Saprolegnia parasitica (strain CBS 223.65) TaxID=695850 RepID=A0A067D528_SAPPC|nr:hypothetical protein SPRG_01685 [Saprolegnia parasitica CBS 223.65]KDO33806.1 hypothetical protein SPRG_01685 [Saprolegnia parasitica CBS 223.65]|eukprot:XP_012195442.1 hypothetical protein SPRG_01685 [Saprolegnia parasitica CBS 223.65]